MLLTAFNAYSPSGIGPGRRRRELHYKRQPLGHNLLNNLVAFYPLQHQSLNTSGVTLSHTGVGNMSNPSVFDMSLRTKGGKTSYDFIGGHLEKSSETAFQTGAGVDVSVQAWVNFDTLPSVNAASGASVIIGKDDVGSSREYTLYGGTTDLFIWRIFNGSTSVGLILTAASFITIDTWYHLVGAYNSAIPEMTFYINGVALTPTTPTNSPAATSTQFRIGRDNGGNNGFDGLIKDVGFWRNRVLSESEAVYLYNGGEGRPYPFV